MLKAIIASGFLLLASPAVAQDEPPGGNAGGGPELSMGHHDGDHLGPIGPYLQAAELRNWPQGTHRRRPEAVVRQRSAAILTEAGLSCVIVEAYNPGVASGRKDMYEVDCAEGPGFLIVADDPPAVMNCLHLAETEALAQARDPDRPKVSLCLLPGNLDAAAQVQSLAVQVDPACAVRSGAWIGRVGEDRDRYEIACRGRDGWWLDAGLNQATVLDSVSCFDLARADQTCRFTDAAAHAALAQTWLGSDTACSVARVRFMGASSPHRYFELACAGGEGRVIRLDPADRPDGSWPCIEAAGIAGGCRLGRD